MGPHVQCGDLVTKTKCTCSKNTQCRPCLTSGSLRFFTASSPFLGLACILFALDIAQGYFDHSVDDLAIPHQRFKSFSGTEQDGSLGQSGLELL
jgi:hypothetical protein